MSTVAEVKPCGCGAEQRCSECIDILEEGETAAVDLISPDAKYIARASRDAAGRIVMHLWIIFVMLPVVLGILFALLKSCGTWSFVGRQ